MNRLFSISKLRLGKWKTEKPSYSQYRLSTEQFKIPEMTRAELEQRIMTTLQEALQYGQTRGVKTVRLDPNMLEPVIHSLANGVVPICNHCNDESGTKPQDPAAIEKLNNEIRIVLAQLVLDELYAMLKSTHGALDTKPDLRRLVRWVAESYNIYPRALLLKGIQLYSDDACAIKAIGGYGNVYRAKRKGRADVAVKCLFLPPPPPGSRFRVREQTEKSKAKGNDGDNVVVVEAGTHLQFREGITWSCLEHPNVLPFLGYHDIVIEHTSGLGLVSPWRDQGHIVAYVERLEEEGKRAPLARLFQDVAQGLTYLHDMSIAHGDLHAGNILITDDGVAQIADLGTAKYLDNSQYTANSIRRAENMWNCPESTRCILQGYSYRPDPASDVYSFGCLWLQIHTRRPVYHPYDPFFLQPLHIAHKTPLLPVGLKKEYSLRDVEDSDAWRPIEACLSDDPEDRPTARELTENLNVDSNWIRDWYTPFHAKAPECQWEYSTRNDDRYGIRGLKIHAELNQDDGISEHTEASLDSSTLGPNTPPEIGKFDMAF
ncbi:kinase-like protein [Panus rudis PR-1116 ss-1]|nr:kinase-like protein [Panus rudis PR-1116 ss-1]